ncbi:MAG: hypothetical protein CL927_16485 [Deltaproteobacteria bacterium]|nr:hypothetical protein [Deltaproteobacteria bacterium]
MSKTAGFFNEYLPNKIEKNPDLATSVNAVFQFNIDGAGSWYANLKGASEVQSGNHDAPDCTITASQDTWEAMLESPGKAAMFVMSGKMKVSDLGQAMKLQKILA